MIPVGSLIGVYVAFVFKHLLGDYYLQTQWMALGKERRRGWLAPLAAHAGVHALGTLAIVLVVRPSLWWLAPVDFVVHGAIDRGKALVGQSLALTKEDRTFWWAIGTDQALHQVTHFAYVVSLMAG